MKLSWSWRSSLYILWATYIHNSHLRHNPVPQCQDAFPTLTYSSRYLVILMTHPQKKIGKFILLFWKLNDDKLKSIVWRQFSKYLFIVYLSSVKSIESISVSMSSIQSISVSMSSIQSISVSMNFLLLLLPFRSTRPLIAVEIEEILKRS